MTVKWFTSVKMLFKSCKNFKELSDENKFLWLMTTEDIFILENLANHIFTCFNIRKHSCSSSKQI